ncbi:hypothetical protein [Avrilella dinanensis]|uniref:Uncharacterized protein n=1 Tax=Avrilella dinanensis TaxID=2008672 RepID=A0A2M9R614_9FLAO|nr:hypothetical protein [Avrilella dinanensis]PJR04312.1 hypothetical protein CDL10_07030 [Avrilella dinanensis]
MTKSKFTGDTYFWGVFMIIPLFSFIVFSIKILQTYNFKLGETLILLLFVTLFYFLINFLKHIKIITIKEDELKYYSLLRPFGKTLNLKDYIGKIITSESGSRGSYQVIYLVNKQNETAFKLMGLHYKNFEEINDAIVLKKINFHPTLSQYFKLLFFEKVQVKSGGNKSETLSTILNIIKIVSIAGAILLILGLIVKQL